MQYTIVGFSGTRYGLTSNQRKTLKFLLKEFKVKRSHHGLCKGADSEFHHICRVMGIAVHGHPPIDKKLIDKRLSGFTILYPEEEYHNMNKRIVNLSEALIAAPRFDYEEEISGTWATIRYAKKVKCPLFIIKPDGNVSYR